MFPDKSVRRQFLIVSAIFLILNNLTSIVGFINTPPGKIFTGARWANSQDLHHYYSIMEQAQRGETMIIYPFTLEGPQQRLSIRPLYQMLGYIQKFFHVRHAVIFRIVCALMGIFLVFSIWWLNGIFFNGQARILALVLVLFSSGYFIWQPESNTFTAVADSPHIGYSLMSIIFLAGLSYKYFFLNAGIWTMLVNGIFLLLLGFIHPFDVVTIGLVITFISIAAVIYNRISLHRSIGGLALLFFLGIPSSIYVLWTTFQDPILNEFREMCIVKSLSVDRFILTYGLLLIFSVYGLIKTAKSNRIEMTFLCGWTVIILLLLFSPLKIQGRFIAGLHLPISLMATYGILHIFYMYKINPFSGKGWLIIFFVVFILFYGNFRLIAINIEAYKTGKYPYYISKNFFYAAEYLRENSVPNDAVLTGVRTANFLPAYSGNLVPWGNKYYTFFGSAEAKWQKIINNQMDPDEELKFFVEKGVRYIFLDDLSRNDVLKKFDLLKRDYLTEVFNKGDISIWQIEN